jgi:hypothetical protein
VAPASSASNSRERVQREAAESAALWSQGRQARRRASELREEIAMRRAERDALAGMARAATDDDPDDS